MRARLTSSWRRPRRGASRGEPTASVSSASAGAADAGSSDRQKRPSRTAECSP